MNFLNRVVSKRQFLYGVFSLINDVFIFMGQYMCSISISIKVVLSFHSYLLINININYYLLVMY